MIVRLDLIPGTYSLEAEKGNVEAMIVEVRLILASCHNLRRAPHSLTQMTYWARELAGLDCCI